VEEKAGRKGTERGGERERVQCKWMAMCEMGGRIRPRIKHEEMSQEDSDLTGNKTEEGEKNGHEVYRKDMKCPSDQWVELFGATDEALNSAASPEWL